MAYALCQAVAVDEQFGSLAAPSLRKVNAEPQEASSEIFFRPFDMHGLRRALPDTWADFLKSHFRDAQHVAFMFGVTERTATNWLNRVGAPRPEFVLKAVKHIPGAIVLLEAA